jgi:hypothetical protein
MDNMSETAPLLVTLHLDNKTEYGVRTFAERNKMPSLDAAIFVLMQLGFQHEYVQFLESCRPPKIIYQEPVKPRKHKKRKHK